jgi:hypothetical protein
MNSVMLKIIEYGVDGDAPEVQGKFLQLRLAGTEYLLFAPKQLHQFHSNLLAHFLEDRELAHHWENEQTLAVDAANVRVVGGGKFRLDSGARTLELFDNSQAFGRFDERDIAARIRAAGHWFSDFSIRVF